MEQQGRNGGDDIGMKIKNQEGPELTQGKDTRARGKIENKIKEKQAYSLSLDGKEIHV